MKGCVSVGARARALVSASESTQPARWSTESRSAAALRRRAWPCRDPARARGQSMRRCRRRRPPAAASGLVVDAVVIRRGSLQFSVPDGDGSTRMRLQNDFPDCLANELRDAASGARRGLAQRGELFLAQVDLALFHICHGGSQTDICQGTTSRVFTWRPYTFLATV